MNLAEQTKSILNALSSGFPLHQLQFILNNHAIILEWLNSDKFKQKYGQSHPYPPLLDPDTINYATTDPRIAWDFNLPLPQSFTLQIHISSGSGGSAVERFLAHCGVEQFNSFLSDSHAMAYMANYQLAQKDGQKALILNGFTDAASQKYWHLARQNLPLIALVRDPIGRMRHLVNHTRPVEQAHTVAHFALQTPVEQTLPAVAYHRAGSRPDLGAVLRDCTSGLYRGLFCLAEKLEAIAPAEVHYVDMSEIVGDRAFGTFCDLAARFGFTPPRESDRAKFAQHANRYAGRLGHLPVTLHAGAIDIIITTPLLATNSALADITDELGVRHDGVILCATREQLNALKNKTLKKSIKSYLNAYFGALSAQEADIKRHLVSTEDVLAHLQSDVKLAREIKAMLDVELAHIKAHRMDIVEGWEDYRRFEAMFA